MLVATAGHIDHGKTALVRALTGVETDRLPEEKARGISIDLGFAYWTPEPGRTIGFIDVPGHERFVRNMLAGVARIDFALLVVASDDGVMPQTVEHLQILDLLGACTGAVAITKCDKVPLERVATVRDEVTALLARTGLAAPLFEVSALTGAGVPELAAALLAAARAETPPPDTGRFFRLAVDRAFTVTGIGTVVTGTARDGTLEPGTKLMLAPHGVEVRVRGLQSAGKPVDRVGTGQRSAISLSGLDLSEVHRGDWLVAPTMYAPTTRIAARLRILGETDAPLKHNASVHLYLGTAAIPVRVLVPGESAIAPGGAALVQLVLHDPTAAATGDRFVIRDQPGRRTLGGGVVVDPFASGGRRHSAVRSAIWAALERPDPADALTALLAIPSHEVDTVAFERRFNLRPETAAALYRAAAAVLLGKTRALPVTRVEALRHEILDALKAFHGAHPEEHGMPLRDVEAALATPISAAARQTLQREMIARHEIASGGSYLKLSSHIPTTNNADVALWHRVLAAAQARGGKPFTAAELAHDLGETETTIKGLLVRMRGTGDVWRVTEKRLLLRQEITCLADQAMALSERADNGFTAADLRDAAGIGRNLAIEVLEFFDRIGVTRRRGDTRTVRPDYQTVLRRAAELERGKSDLAFAPKRRPMPKRR